MEQHFYSEHRPAAITHAYNSLDYFVNYALSPFSPDRNVAILVGIYAPPQEERIIIYNTEQMSCDRHRAHLLERVRGRIDADVLEVWDYSEYNVRVLSSLFDEANISISVRHVPLRVAGAHLCRLSLLCARQGPKEYDVGFCGTPSERRESVLNFIESQGISVHRVCYFGERRDRELAKCKIILNIHYSDDYRVFERLRCEPWLAVGTPVVSEESEDNDSRCTYTAYFDIPRVVQEKLMVLQ